MSKNLGSRSRGHSLSVKQLIDERINKLEEQQIAEIEAEFSQKHAVIQNSIRVKSLRLRNELVDIDSLEANAQSISQAIETKFSVLLDTLTVNSLCKRSLGVSRENLGGSIHDLVATSTCQGELVDIDGYVEEILQFDESVKGQFMQYLENSNTECPEQLTSKHIADSVHSSLIGGICESLQRGRGDASCDLDVRCPRITKPKTGTFHNRAAEFTRPSRVGYMQIEKLENAKALLRRLQSITELEYHFQRQVDDELSIIDGKYLKLIAEASFAVYEEAMRSDQIVSRAGLDPLWTKKLIPAVLKGNETLVKDVVSVLSAYANTKYPTDRRIQKLVQIESSKANFN